jgi:hypothetical protein
VLPHIKILLSANVASTNNPTLGEAAPHSDAPTIFETKDTLWVVDPPMLT